MLMKKNDSLLLVIDVQERLAPAMDNPREVINGCAVLLGVARELDVPTSLLNNTHRDWGKPWWICVTKREKKRFICPNSNFPACAMMMFLPLSKRAVKRRLSSPGSKTHICIIQTAFELKEAGYEVFVVSNACSSRKQIQHVLGLQRLMHGGIEVVTIEMVIFEWLEKAGSQQFKDITRKYVI